MIDEKRIKRFIEGSKKAYKEVDDPTFTFPMNILSAYELATSIEDLLKAQEPRVMTLDEALEADVCWLEISGSDRVSPCRIGGVNDFFSIRRIDQTPEVCAKKNYGWLLRCWSARPTDEQREAVKWDADTSD